MRVVGEAGNGYEAVKAAQDLKPDVVVMDFALPGLMGGAATQQILQLVPDTSVLILSMHSEGSYVRAALDAGARGYLLKNATDMGLAEAVRVSPRVASCSIPWVMKGRPNFGEGTRPLSARELQVLQLIGSGKSGREIARALGISACTAAVHRANIMRALALRKASKLTLYAIGRGLVGIQ